MLREEELQRKLHPKLVHKPKKAGARNAKMAARAAASLRTAQHRAALAREAALRKEHLVVSVLPGVCVAMQLMQLIQLIQLMQLIQLNPLLLPFLLHA